MTLSLEVLINAIEKYTLFHTVTSLIEYFFFFLFFFKEKKNGRYLLIYTNLRGRVSFVHTNLEGGRGGRELGLGLGGSVVLQGF